MSHLENPCETCIIINNSKKVVRIRKRRVSITTVNVIMNYLKRLYRRNDTRTEKQVTLLSQMACRTNIIGLNGKILKILGNET